MLDFREMTKNIFFRNVSEVKNMKEFNCSNSEEWVWSRERDGNRLRRQFDDNLEVDLAVESNYETDLDDVQKIHIQHLK